MGFTKLGDPFVRAIALLIVVETDTLIAFEGRTRNR